MDYCISDIHGYYDLFCRLLDKIKFGGGDKLYVLGISSIRGRIVSVLPNFCFPCRTRIASRAIMSTIF